MSKLRDALKALKDEQAAYHEKAADLTSAEIAKETEKFKTLRQNIQDILTEGAKDCPDCKGPAIGMFHDGTPNPFEVGCKTCPGHRVRAALPDDAIDAWNAAEGGLDPENDLKDDGGNVLAQGYKGYMKPREPGTAIARIHNVDGSVKEERTIRAHSPKRK